MQIGATLMTESDEEKILGIMLDKHLDFKCHLHSLCKKLARSCMHLDIFHAMLML